MKSKHPAKQPSVQQAAPYHTLLMALSFQLATAALMRPAVLF